MKKNKKTARPPVDFRDDYPRFTPGMKHTHKILVPDMLPVHFGIIGRFPPQGRWDIEVLGNDSRAVIDEGLKHVHNDTCYPALCVTGQFIDALKSGKYDPERTAVMITQSAAAAAPPTISRSSARRSKASSRMCLSSPSTSRGWKKTAASPSARKRC